MKKFHKDFNHFLKDVCSTFRALFDNSRSYNLMLFVIIFIGAACRLYILLIRPLGSDETIFYLLFSKPPIWEMLNDLRTSHVFHNILVHISYRIFGEHIWAIRLPAFFFGCLVPIGAYIFARVYYKKASAALFATALVSVSGVMVCYSANARGYTLITLLFLLILILVKYIVRHRNFTALLLFSFLCALSLFTLISFAYMILVIIVWIFVCWLTDYKEVKPWKLIRDLMIAAIATLIITGLLYSPLIARAGFDISNIKILEQLDLKFTPQKFVTTLIKVAMPQYWEFFNLGFLSWMVVLCLIGVILAVIFNYDICYQRFSIIIVMLVTIFLTLYFQKILPFDRLWIPFVAVYFIVAGAGLSLILETFKDHRYVYQPFLLICAMTILLTGAGRIVQKPHVVFYDSRIWDAQEILRFLKNHLQKEDRILYRPFSSNYTDIFNFYLDLNEMSPWKGKFHKIEKDMLVTRSSSYKGDLYAISIEYDRQKCRESLHCEGNLDLENLLKIINSQMFKPPKLMAQFKHGTKIHHLENRKNK